MINTKIVHLSIDDIGKSLEWLSRNHPGSIFDMRLYGNLMEWHKKYNVSFTLYCFTNLPKFSISEIPDSYSREFEANADWLRFGFHGIEGTKRFVDEPLYKEGVRLFEETAIKLGMSISPIIRLHNWIASEEQKEYLYNRGVKVLLYPDDDTFGYSGDSFFDCGLEHWRTRIRFENMDEIDDDSLLVGQERIVAFTHEKYFDTNKEKIEKAILIYKQNGYSFV